MIQLKKKIEFEVPEILSTKGEALTQQIIEDLTNNIAIEKISFDPNVYGHPDVKSVLINVQDKKCCFCESKITHISYGDVEHFRPKGGWIQKDEPLNKPGYYWLAYNWDNLFLSCQICNQRFKKNLFPLENPENRVKGHGGDISEEKPLFIHPVNDNPEEHIEFYEEIPKGISSRGKITIENLGLDREDINEQRREKYRIMENLYNLAKGIPKTEPISKERARNFILEEYEIAKQDHTEYASMLRCFFRKNPINF